MASCSRSAGGDPQQAELQKQLEAAMERDVPGYLAVQIAVPIVGLAEALALLVAGIGLLGMHSWARTLALAAALIAMASTAFQVVYNAVFVLPATSNALDVVLPANMPKNVGPAGPEIAKVMQVVIPTILVVTLVILSLFILYLSIIVLLLLLRHVRAAFATAGLPAEAREQPDSGEEDEGWGRSPPPQNPDDQGLYRKG